VRQQTVRRRREGSYVATAAREEFECDLAEFGDGFGGGARCALVCVDVFNKKCAAVPMVDKRPQTTAAALRQCFSELGVPVRIYTDEGSEFQNSTVEPMLASLNVALVTTRGYANFVERMIRTLKERLRIRHLTFGEPWDRLLPAVVKQYNDQAHSATRMAPKLAALDENPDLVRARLQKRAKPSRRPPLVVGDIVRIARPHTAGRRVRDVQFGAEAYPVQEIVYEGGVTRYRVNERLYLRHDLLKITDIRAPSGQSRILDEDDQPLVPRVSRAMQQQYNRNVNRRLALGRMTGDSINFVYARDEDDEPLSNLAAAAPAPAAAPAASDDDAPLLRRPPAAAPAPAPSAPTAPATPDDEAPLIRLVRPSPKAPAPKAIPFEEAPITGGSSSSRGEIPQAKAPPREMPPPSRPLAVIHSQRRRAVNDGRDTSALDDEFYRKVAEIRGVPYSPLTSAQLKYQSVAAAIRDLRRRGYDEARRQPRDPQEPGPAWRAGLTHRQNSDYNTLVAEYSTLWPAVSWDPRIMPDPERQRIRDLDLER
jgi:hypothetical protein